MGLLGKRVCVGLDIGSSRIRALQMERAGASWKIVRRAHADTPVDCVRDGVVTDPQVLGEAIRTMLKEARIPATSACIAAAGGAVFVRPVSFPKMAESVLRKSIRYEASRYVPGSVDDSYVEFEIIGPAENDQMNVLIVAAPRDIVESRIAACHEAGLDVEVVDVEVFAAYRALLECDVDFDPATMTVGIVEIGAQSSTVSVVHQGVFAMHRSIPHGGRLLTDALAQQFGLPVTEAEEGKATLDVSELVGALVPPENPPLRVILPHLEDLVREIRRSVNYFQSQQPEGSAGRQVQRLVLTGGGARMKGLDLYLDHRLGIPVIESGLYDNPRFVGATAEEGRGVDLGVAAGLALRAHTRAA
jgi:type IV pilus assembly protein PilM